LELLRGQEDTQELLFIGSGRWYGTLAMECLVVWVIVTTGPEEMIATEEISQEEAKERKKKEKEKKTKDKSRKERKRTRNYADALRPWKSPIATTRPNNYLEEREYFEEQHDDEQCAYYHQKHIEEMLNDIRKRLYQRSQPARKSRHSRWEKEMQLRRKQKKEEQATEVQVIISRGHHLRDGATTRAKEEGRQEEERDNETQPHHRMDLRMAGADYATRRNGRTRAAIKDGITGTTKDTPQRRHAQSQRRGESFLINRAVFGWGGQRHKATNRAGQPAKSNDKSRLT
jgi:hypothetical protein